MQLLAGGGELAALSLALERAGLEPTPHEASADCVLVAHAPPLVDAVALLAGLRGPEGSLRRPVVVLARDAAARRAALRAGALEVTAPEGLDPDALCEIVQRAQDRFDALAGAGQASWGGAGERYRTTFEKAPVGMAHVDVDGRWLSFNQAFARITGYTVDELRDHTFAEITHPDDVATDWAQARRLLAGEIPSYTMDKRYVRKDGVVVWVQLTGSLAHDPATDRPYFIAVVEDIGARKAAERERAELLGLVEQSSDLIATSALDGRQTYLNPGGRRMLGIPLDAELGSLHLADYVAPEQRAFFEDTVLREVREQGGWRGEMQLVNLATGQRLDVHRATSLLRDPDTGEPWCFATVARDITAEKAFARQLAKVHAQLRATLAATDVGLWRWDPALDQVVGDRNLVRLFGFEPEHEASPLAPYLDRIHEGDRERVRAAIARTVAEGGRYDQEYRVVHPSGEVRWLHARGQVERGESGAIAFPGVALDVTERVQAQARLRESDQRYRALLDAVEDGFCIVDVVFDGAGRPVDYRFVELNRSFERHTGLVDAVGRTALELVPDLDRHWVEAYGRVALTGESVRFQRHEPAMGRWFEVEAMRVGDPDHRRVAILFRDITAQRRTEEELRRSEARFRGLVQDAPVAVSIVVGTEGRIELANTAYEEMTGRPFVVGRTIAELFPELPPDSPVFGLYRRCIEAGEPVHATEVPVVFDPGGGLEERFLMMSLRPLEVEEGSPPRVMTVSVDVTDQVRARREVEDLVGQLRRTEQELRRSEWRLKRIFDTNLLGILFFDLSGPVQGANDAFLEIIGYERSDLERGLIDWVRLTPPEHTEQDRHALEVLRERGAHPAIEKEYVRKDGSRVWVLVGSALLEQDRGVGFVLDISRSKRVEAALRESDNRAREAAGRAEAERAVLDAILEAAPAGIIVAEAGGRLVRTNPANVLLWGPTPASESVDEYREWKGWWVEPPELRGQRLEPEEWAMARALRGETVRGDIVEIEPFDRPGTRRTMVNSGAPVRDREGHVLGAVIVQMNITELVAAEAARRESEALFRVLADDMAQLAWMADEHGRVFWYNRRWFEFTGTTPQEAEGRGWEASHHPEHRARVVAKFREHLVSGEPWEDTFPLRGRDGRYRWFLSRAVPVRDESGRVVRWFGTNTDITRQREAEEALREADRRKDDFIAILAHELRNPLAPVRTAVEILKRAGTTDPRAARANQVLERQVAHMARLIDDLLDVSRIARGKLALRLQVCDLAEIGRQTAEDYRANLEAAGLSLVVETPPSPAYVLGDPVRLAQMIGNLLNNAGRFTEPGGRVEVRVEVDDEARRGLVRVIDTGVGLDQAMAHRLFDPFSQADQGLARSKGGLGLGLALTRGLAELHGGGVVAESEGPGRGSTFWIWVPLAEGAPRASSAEPRRGAVGGLKVLVVEDNADAAQTLGELLELDGHEVRVAHDADSGLDVARAFGPDVVISDLGLPGGRDGYDLARALRADPRFRGARLIALSGYANEDARRRSEDAGFDLHLAKPPDVAALERALARVTGR